MTRPQWQSNIVDAYQRLNESQQAAGERFIQTVNRAGDTFAKLGKEAYEVIKDYNKTAIENKKLKDSSEFSKGMMTAKTAAERAAFAASFDMTFVDPQLAVQTFTQLKQSDQLDKQYLLQEKQYEEQKRSNLANELYQRFSFLIQNNSKIAADQRNVIAQIAESMTKKGADPKIVANMVKTQNERIDRELGMANAYYQHELGVGWEGNSQESFDTRNVNPIYRTDGNDIYSASNFNGNYYKEYINDKGTIYEHVVNKDTGKVAKSTMISNPSAVQIQAASTGSTFDVQKPTNTAAKTVSDKVKAKGGGSSQHKPATQTVNSTVTQSQVVQQQTPQTTSITIGSNTFTKEDVENIKLKTGIDLSNLGQQKSNDTDITVSKYNAPVAPGNPQGKATPNPQTASSKSKLDKKDLDSIKQMSNIEVLSKLDLGYQKTNKTNLKLNEEFMKSLYNGFPSSTPHNMSAIFSTTSATVNPYSVIDYLNKYSNGKFHFQPSKDKPLMNSKNSISKFNFRRISTTNGQIVFEVWYSK